VREIVLSGRGPNAMTRASLEAFVAEMEHADGEPLLLRGAGNAFSAGLDLDALAGDVHELLDAMESAIAKLFLYPAPTVACVNGHAIAGGCLLAVACDHRVASNDPQLRMGMTAVSLGLVYPPTVLEVLRYRLPSHTIDRVLLGAERFTAPEALALGLVDELADDVRAVATERLERLASHPREPYAHAKRALRRRALAIDDVERRALLADAARAWDPAIVRARLRGR
jgi:enoyl-CoA hydratase